MRASTQVIDLDVLRAQRDQLDAEHVILDDYGRPMFRFALEYEMGGKQWSAEVWVYNLADAEARVDAMRSGLTVLGKVQKWVAG